MGIFNWFRGFFADDVDIHNRVEPMLDDSDYVTGQQLFDDAPISQDSFEDDMLVNPATGLPMIGGYGGVDAAGNPFGSSDWDDENVPGMTGEDINPASGLPMEGGVDIMGNPFGESDYGSFDDYHDDHDFGVGSDW